MSATSITLLVDDAPERLAGLTSLLRGAGYRVRQPAAEALDPDAMDRDRAIAARVARAVGAVDGLADDTSDGSTARMPGVGSAVMDPDEWEGRDQGIVLERTSRDDIVEGLDSEEELERVRRELAQARRATKRLMQMLVHDLRTPLSGIILNLEMLQEAAPPLPDEEGEDLAYALSAARDLAASMSTLNDIVRLDAGDMPLSPCPTDLVALSRKALSRLDGPPADVILQTDAEALIVSCDPDVTRSVLDRLLAGAAEVTPNGMPITVRLSMSDELTRVEVSDGGVTLPERARLLVFDEASVAEVREAGHRRAGLELVFCASAIRAQGGGIGVRAPAPGDSSDDGRGNVFWFELPTAPGVAARESA